MPIKLPIRWRELQPSLAAELLAWPGVKTPRWHRDDASADPVFDLSGYVSVSEDVAALVGQRVGISGAWWRSEGLTDAQARALAPFAQESLCAERVSEPGWRMLYQYQQESSQRLAADVHRGLWWPPGCVSGDAYVYVRCSEERGTLIRLREFVATYTAAMDSNARCLRSAGLVPTYVRSFNRHTGFDCWRLVTAAHVGGVRRTLYLIRADASSIRLTPDHRVLVWLSAAKAFAWRRADEVVPMRDLVYPFRRDDVVEQVLDGEETDVYDLTVAGTHAYLANGMVVHNCGKTITALSAARLRKAERTLVVTSSTGRRAWARDAAKLQAGFRTAVIAGRSADTPGSRLYAAALDATLNDYRDADPTGACVATNDLAGVICAGVSDLVVLNWETLNDRLDDLRTARWPVVVFDEHHKAAKWTSGMSKAHKALKRAAGVCWSLTATPVRALLRDLRQQLAVVAPEAWGQFCWMQEGSEAAGEEIRLPDGTVLQAEQRWKLRPAFDVRYLHATVGRYGEWDNTGPHAPGTCPWCDVAYAELSYRCGYWFDVKTRDMIAHQLPPRRIEILRVPASEAAKNYDAGRGRKGLEAKLAVSSAAKHQVALDIVMECLLTGGKCAVVGPRRKWLGKMLQSIRKEAEKSPRLRGLLWLEGVMGSGEGEGSTTVTKRARVIDEYQAKDGSACLVATLDAVQESIDAQNTDIVVLCVVPTTYEELAQILGRFNRIGGRAVTCYVLVADGTSDEERLRVVEGRTSSVARVGADTMKATLRAPRGDRRRRAQERARAMAEAARQES